MTGGEDSPRLSADAVTLENVRAYLRDEFNRAIRFPDMYGGETAANLYLYALEVAHGHDRAAAEMHGLRARGAFNASGVPGAFQAVFPGLIASRPVALKAGIDDMTTSVYAEIGHHLNWLDLDRTLSSSEQETIEQSIRDWCALDRTASQVAQTFGRPSVHIGGSNRCWPETVLYAAAGPDGPCVSFHLWNSFTGTSPGASTEYPEPMLLAARTDGKPFQDSFIFTPIGQKLHAASP